jgi:ABC-type multidrug transport system fused ATPase/permease subunit
LDDKGGIILLFCFVGLAAFGVIAVMAFILCANLFIFKFTMKYQDQLMSLQDKRMKLISETLQGIFVIKLFAWELFTKRKITDVRKEELASLRKYLNCGAWMMLIILTGDHLMAAGALAVYYLLGYQLTISVMIPLITLVLNLTWPLLDIPMVLRSAAEAWTSLTRLEAYLLKEELVPTFNQSLSSNEESFVEIQDGSFRWEMSQQPTLSNVNLRVSGNKLVAIVGTVGSGKSSILGAILGELKKLNGRVTIKGSVAYVPQQPWIRNDTLKNNILFGNDYDSNRYR